MGELGKKSPIYLKITGLVLSESYQRCKIFSRQLRKHHKKQFLEPAIQGLLEVDWLEYLEKLRKTQGGQTWALSKGVAVFVGRIFIGGEEEFFERFKLYVCNPLFKEELTSSAKEEYLRYLNLGNLTYTHLDLALDGEYMGTLLMELRSDLLPKTCAWFAMLCDPNNYLGYSYKGSRVHRVCKSGWFQAGDLEPDVPHEARFMEDETYCYKHDRRGVLSFAKDGKDTSRFQFFVTFKPSVWMDEYYVAFGRVVEGSDVLRRIEYTKCTYESPDRTITIADCGLARVGLGRSMVTTKRIKALTVGEPHIHLDTFMNLVFDRFCEVLLDRLDEEEKRNLHGKWLAQALWDRVQANLVTRRPVEDFSDLKDKSSQLFRATRYLVGLYGFQDIPDHFVKKMLNQVVDDAVDRSDTIRMADSVLQFLLDSLDYSRSPSQLIAAGVVNNLIDYVYSIIFDFTKVTSGTVQSLTESIEIISSENMKVISTDDLSRDRTEGEGSKESIVAFIWEALFNSFRYLTEDNQPS